MNIYTTSENELVIDITNQELLAVVQEAFKPEFLNGHLVTEIIPVPDYSNPSNNKYLVRIGDSVFSEFYASSLHHYIISEYALNRTNQYVKSLIRRHNGDWFLILAYPCLSFGTTTDPQNAVSK